MSIDKNMITTTFELHEHRIVTTFGVVNGISVRAQNWSGGWSAWFQLFFGGDIPAYRSLCEQTRQEALDRLISHAQELGANAIIGMRFDANEVMGGVTEVLAYGTAVWVEKKV